MQAVQQISSDRNRDALAEQRANLQAPAYGKVQSVTADDDEQVFEELAASGQTPCDTLPLQMDFKHETRSDLMVSLFPDLLVW